MTQHFLYLTNDKLIALIWKGGVFVERTIFNASDADSQEFTAYIAQHSDIPTHVVTDLIEEDFRVDTVPHLRGGDQDAVMSRKLAQLYRATTFRHAVVQEREAEGRRDDRVLYHAITNPELVNPWLGALERAEVPLEGIHSSAVLSARLPKELNVFFAHTLLVTIVPDFGLRQTYFQNKHVKFSRLTPIIYDENQSVGTLIAAETSRTWQYLDSLRFFGGSETLEVCILVHVRDREMVAEAIRSYPMLKYRFLDIEEVAAKLKLKPAPTSSHAEEVLVHLYAQGKIENHFAEKGQTRFATYRKARIGLYGLAVGLLAMGVIGAAFNLYQSSNYSAEIDQSNFASRSIQSEYQSIAKEMSLQTTATDTVRDASSFFRAQISPQSSAPGTSLRAVAAVWSEFPEMELLQVVWARSDESGFVPPFQPAVAVATQNVKSEVKVMPGAAPARVSAPTGVDDAAPMPGREFEVMVVEGAIKNFNGDYRQALKNIDRLIERFNATPGTKAEALVLPLDIKSNTLLRANTTAQDATEVRFSIRVTRIRVKT